MGFLGRNPPDRSSRAIDVVALQQQLKCAIAKMQYPLLAQSV